MLSATDISFTFHNVSINTIANETYSPTMDNTLHSTMFLLILLLQKRIQVMATIFTFHNVSINTNSAINQAADSISSLQSTMFLLIPNQLRKSRIAINYFTFHNVSINTSVILFLGYFSLPLHSTMFLLILRWKL